MSGKCLLFKKFLLIAVLYAILFIK